MKYIKGLDSLRAIAVLMVIAWHWLPSNEVQTVPVGPAGVTIFFVLSGFLITRILLEGRAVAEISGKGKQVFIANFIFRRALRILPIYYLVVIPAFCYAVFMNLDLEKFGYLFTFTSNFYFLKMQSWDIYFSHTWTLAIEEQFYLLWPIVIVFLRRKYMLPCILAFIVVGIGSQYLVSGEGFRMYMLYACCDTFGVGALLAWVVVYKPGLLKAFRNVSGLLAVLAFILIYLQIYQWYELAFPLRIQLSVITIFFISYIIHASISETPMPKLLALLINSNALAGLGKISYSMYLYHIFVPKLTGIFTYSIFKYLPVLVQDRFQYFMFPFNFLLLVFISRLSWKYIEKPMLSFKKYSFTRKPNWKFHSLEKAVSSA